MKATMITATLLGSICLAATATARDNMMHAVNASDQDVSGGTVTASEIIASANGWLVVHRTDAAKKPGPVVGHAPLKKGKNTEVTAILTEPVKKGEMLMLMLHAEQGGRKTGIFEYTLGAKEDGPVRVDGKLVMAIVTTK